MNYDRQQWQSNLIESSVHPGIPGSKMHDFVQ